MTSFLSNTAAPYCWSFPVVAVFPFPSSFPKRQRLVIGVFPLSFLRPFSLGCQLSPLLATGTAVSSTQKNENLRKTVISSQPNLFFSPLVWVSFYCISRILFALIVLCLRRNNWFSVLYGCVVDILSSL